MKVAVFGAAGWVGRAVLENFAGKHEVRAFEINPAAWDVYRDIDGEWEGEKVYGDIADFHAVDKALEGLDGVVHLTAYFGGEKPPEEDEKPFLVNVKGLWNVLESARQRELVRVVHMGSCQVEHPDGIFFSADIRRPDASLYAVGKRLQEELCRQYHDAYAQRIIVFRPASIIDTRSNTGRDGQPAAAVPAGSAATTWPRPVTWRSNPPPLISISCTPRAIPRRKNTATWRARASFWAWSTKGS